MCYFDYVNEIKNTRVANASDYDVVIPIYYFLEYSDKYFKISDKLWQYCRDESDDNEVADSYQNIHIILAMQVLHM